jgi:hypothetical protein
MPMTARERSLRAQAAALESHVRCEDPAARTAAARAASPAGLDYWYVRVDPSGELRPDERERRAGQARRAWYARNTYKSLRARALAAEARHQALELDQAALAAESALADFEAQGQQ